MGTAQFGPARGRRGVAGVTAAAVLLTAGIVAGVVVVVGGRLLHPSADGDPQRVCGADALQSLAVAGLATFAAWLRQGHATGYVGEVGWPGDRDDAKWDALADTWYRAADALALPVTAWAAARWPTGYPMAVYRLAPTAGASEDAGLPAEVVEAHGTTARYPRGVVLAGGSFGTADTRFDSVHPGRYGYDYTYETSDGYAYLASRGVRLVRLAVVWERLQPTPGGPLDAVELSRVLGALDAARRAGLRVIVDLHNYGTFALGTASGQTRRLVLGSAELPVGYLADLWAHLASATRDQPALLGYDLLNEPLTLASHGTAGAALWERASQAAVDAIRSTGSTAVIAVAGYGTTAPGQWGTLHPRPWITDATDRIWYDAHAYFDADSSGHYANTYADEVDRAGRQHPVRCQLLPAAVPATRTGAPHD